LPGSKLTRLLKPWIAYFDERDEEFPGDAQL